MQASIKSKLTLGLGFLFLIILLLSGVGAYFLYHLSHSAEATLHDNYRSVAYAQHLNDALADLRNVRPTAATQARQMFERSLQAEQRNIPEPSEGRLVYSLTVGFRQYLLTEPAAAEASQADYQHLRGQVARVTAINLRTIEQQSTRTRRIANRTITTLGRLAALGIPATFSFIFTFPDYVTRPVAELTAGCSRRLATDDYNQRLSTTTHPDFFEVAVAFNNITHKLKGYKTAGSSTTRRPAISNSKFATLNS